MKYNPLIIASLLILTLSACKDNSINPSNGEWLIPENEIFDGGPGKDGIPSVDRPTFVSVSNASGLSPEDLVVGIVSGNTARAYPHFILDWHEIVNDEVEDISVALTYCPLTGTASGWNRIINGQKTTFGVSGLLYNTNLIPYDRETDSNWSQMRLECVNGSLSGQKVDLHMVVETTWETWSEMYPDSEVLTTNTGFNRNYGFYPYGDYRESERLLFSVSNDDRRLPRKERVLGVDINGKAKAYSIESFEAESKLIEDVINGVPVMVIGNKAKNFIVSFESKLPDGTTPTMTAVQNQLPIILSDLEGNQWDIFGYARSGPRVGERLIPTRSYIGYFFAWGAFYEDLELYER